MFGLPVQIFYNRCVGYKPVFLIDYITQYAQAFLMLGVRVLQNIVIKIRSVGNSPGVGIFYNVKIPSAPIIKLMYVACEIVFAAQFNKIIQIFVVVFLHNKIQTHKMIFVSFS